MAPEHPPERVFTFISYSHDSDKHRELVRGLQASLSRDGCDCQLDVYKDTDEDWLLWMTRQLEEADFILCVITETYARRFCDKELRDVGLGVGWEAGLIRRLLSKEKLHNDRIFPVLFAHQERQHVPLVLQGYDDFLLDSDAGYEALVRKLLKQPRYTRPAIGTAPILSSTTTAPLFARPGDASTSTRAAQRANSESEKPAVKKAVDSVTTEEPERLGDETGTPERRPEGENPYRELSYYDVDNDYFYGRRDFVESVIRQLETRLADPSCTAACRITGNSGAGKSSVLRAGILRKLGEQGGKYRWAVFRPELFKDRAGLDIDVLTTILDEIEVQAHVEISASQRSAIGRAGASAPLEGAHAVMAEFKRNMPEGGRLILALDQFEEIVDELGSSQRRERWQPLLRFLETASRHPEFGMIYTLESSRATQYGRLNLPPPFRNAFEAEVDDFVPSNVEAIIWEPFEKTRYPLAKDVITVLEKEFLRLGSKRSVRSSFLPLLSLKLHTLWDFVATDFGPIATIGGAAGFVSEDKKISKDELERRGQKLDLGSVMNDLATKAWLRADAGEVDEEKLGYFLRPFVGVEGDHFQLLAVPRKAGYEDEQKLVDSFLKHRLLVGVGDGLVRFVHQAVLDHWKEAKGWLSQHRPFLERVAAMRIAAQDWENKGRPKIASRARKLEQDISSAAEILVNYIRAWSFDDARIYKPDRLLKDYCMAVFEKSKTPRRHLVRGPGAKHSHVTLAAMYGMTKLVERFSRIDESCLYDLSSEKEDAYRPLVSAAWSHLSTVQYLLGKGVSPFKKSADGWPPVHAAISRGCVDIFHELMNAAAKSCTGEALEIELICPNQRTLAFGAAWFDAADMLRELIDQYRFSPTRRDGVGGLPIHAAAMSGALATFDFLCERHGCDATVEQTEETCLHLAARRGKKGIIDKILRSPAGRELLEREDRIGWTALHHAAYGHHAECITALLKSDLDPNRKSRDGDTALHLILKAAPNGIGILRRRGIENYDEDKAVTALRAILGDKRTNPNAEDSSGEHPLALIDRNRRLLHELLGDERVTLREPIRTGGDTGIFLAARENIWSTVERFIVQNGFPPGTDTDSEGNTFLHYLTARSADLLSNNMEQITNEQLNARNKKGQTPLYRALTEKKWLLAERMLDTGRIEIHRSTDALDWEFLIAITSGAGKSVLKKLAAAIGQRLSEPDDDGWTLLHHVAAANHFPWTEALSTLVELDQLWSVPDKMGRRPIDVCDSSIAALAPKGLHPSPWPESCTWDHDVSWKVAANAETQTLIARAGLGDVDAKQWEMTRGTLAFYPGKSILRFKPREDGTLLPVYYWLDDGENLRRLNGKSPPIHEFNAKHLMLTADCVRNYLHFFCFFVRGEEGPFFILEDASFATLSATTTKEDRTKIAELAMPAWLIGQRNGDFRFLARIFYGNSIFNAYFKIFATGMIEMEKDFPVLSNLSGRVEMPLA